MNGLIQWSPGVTLEAVEKQVILAAFRHYRGNKTATANALGISVKTVDNKLEKYEVEGKAEKERFENGRGDAQEMLKRHRGNVPDNIGTGFDGPAATAAPQRSGDDGADAGIRTQSPSGPATQQTVPVSERKEVQGVLPQQAAALHSRKSR